METGADISECGIYRYLLWRIWNEDKRRLVFIMLNPSTASYTTNDPTIKRCIKFAAMHGYGGIIVANLFAYRATDPNELPGDERAVGPNNDTVLKNIKAHSGYYVDVCFAWGADRKIGDRAKQVIAMFPDALCLERTKQGHPKHPLFIKASARLFAFAPQQ